LGHECQVSGSADFLWLTPLRVFFIMATNDLDYLDGIAKGWKNG
jgi:hypothetical protein